MGANAGISDLIAAELSQAAYPGYSPPLGWEANSTYSYTNSTAFGTNSFTTFINTTTQQVVIAFKGSDTFSNWVSDLANNGGSAWESLAPELQQVIAAIESDPSLAGYQIMTDGHSLGGGMAQTAALEYGLSGYGQNSLPVSNEAATTDTAITSLGGFANTLAVWQSEGNTFREINLSGDPATLYYSSIRDLNYINTTTITLANTYAALEAGGVIDASPILMAIGAYESHSIGTVIQLELNDTTTGDSSAIDAILASDNSVIDSAINSVPLTFSSTGALTATASNGQVFSVSLVSAGTNTDTYAVSINGQPNQIDVVTTNGGAITINTEIDTGATVEVQAGGAASTGVTQDFTFLGSTGTLKIDNPASFQGTVSGFVPGDTIDLVGIGLATSATLGANNVLTVKGSGGVASLQLDSTQSFSGDSFNYSQDGSGGTAITETAWSVAPINPLVSENAGNEIFTITRTGDTSQAQTVYVSTTDGSTVQGESLNSGQFQALSNQPVTFAAGQASSGVYVTINDQQIVSSEYSNYGIIVASSASQDASALTKAQFSIADNDTGIYQSVTYTYEGNPFTDANWNNGNYFQAGSITASFTINNVPVGYTGWSYQLNQNSSYAIQGISSGYISAYGQTANYTGGAECNASLYLINGQVATALIKAEVHYSSGYVLMHSWYDVGNQLSYDPVGSLCSDSADEGDYGGNANGSTSSPGTWASTIACYCRGTRILTQNGEVAIEALEIGDRVITASGEAKPIRWIGLRSVASRFADPLRCWPVRIKAGALGDNVPSRDLRLSPDHALLVGDVLIQAGALVNGASILRETQAPDRFTYYHVELDDHELIFAENTPAETFVDNIDRMGFDNWTEYEALYPEGKRIEEMPYPRAKAHRQVPMRVKSLLAERASAIGQSADVA